MGGVPVSVLEVLMAVHVECQARLGELQAEAVKAEVLRLVVLTLSPEAAVVTEAVTAGVSRAADLEVRDFHDAGWGFGIARFLVTDDVLAATLDGADGRAC